MIGRREVRPPVVFANTTCGCGVDGIPYSIREGEPWAGDDPLVEANPGLFSNVPTVIMRTVPAPAD